MRALAAALVMLALAGCMHEDPPVAEHPIAAWAIELSGGSESHQFEIAGGEAYWRVDLAARSQQAVRYEAVAPGGARHNSTDEGAPFPYTHRLRVDAPAAGTWTITIRADRVVDGTMQILVPD